MEQVGGGAGGERNCRKIVQGEARGPRYGGKGFYDKMDLLPAMCPNWAAKLVPAGAGFPITLRWALLKHSAVSAVSRVWISWSNRPNTSCL